jgi:hypothetical protein
MVKNEKKTLDEVLDSLDSRQKGTTMKLRMLVKRAVPETVEIIRQGKITYILDGEDFVWLNQTSDHVDIAFFMGSGLDSDLFRQNGIREKRETVSHIEVRNADNLEIELTRLLKDASRIGSTHCPPRASK